MKRRPPTLTVATYAILWIIALLLTPFTGCGGESDAMNFQGEWSPITLICNGKARISNGKSVGWPGYERRIVFTGTTFADIVTEYGKEVASIRGTFSIDPVRKTIDLIDSEGLRHQIGFYKRVGRKMELVVRWKNSPDITRPTRFGEEGEFTNSFLLKKQGR